MGVPNGEHTVGGLKLRKAPGKWPFEVLEDYPCDWKGNPKPRGNPARFIKNSAGKPVASFREVRAVTLLTGYSWDGNSGPAVNTLKCLRASALHDAWCQAMKLGIFENSLRNWRAGASEYRKICRADGMWRVRAWTRYIAIMSYGVIKKATGNLSEGPPPRDRSGGERR